MSIAENFEIIADEVYAKGKKDEYDKFWDNYQTKTNFSSMFYYWPDECIYPKKAIKPTGTAANMFFGCGIKGSLTERFRNCGMELDTSGANNLNGCFQACYHLTHTPTLDLQGLRAGSTIENLYYGCRQLIEASLKNVSETFKFTSVFYVCDSLEEFTIDGTIGQSGFDVKSCKKMSVASLLSILTALSKESSVASGKSVTFADNHLAIIEDNEACLTQLSNAAGAGWSIFFGTTPYEGQEG